MTGNPWWQQQRAKGLCGWAGCSRVPDKGALCAWHKRYQDKHHEKHRKQTWTRAMRTESMRRLREERIERGVCSNCAKRPLGSRTLCNVCADEKARKERARKERNGKEAVQSTPSRLSLLAARHGVLRAGLSEVRGQEGNGNRDGE